MPILPFINLKGGVAKTTNAVAVAECLAVKGLRVLLIDADHQCMSSELMLGETRMLRCDYRRLTLHDLLMAMLKDDFKPELIDRCIVERVSDIGEGLENLSVLPCSVRIDDFQTNFSKARRRSASTGEFQAMFNRQRSALRRTFNARFDIVLIDCPPSVAVQVKAFLPLATGYVVPSVPDRLSVRGSLYLLDRLRRLNVKVPGVGTLWSLFRAQNTMHREIVEAVRLRHGSYAQLPLPFETVIPNAAAIALSTEPDRNPHSFTAKYTPPFARMYHALCDELMMRVGLAGGNQVAPGAAVAAAEQVAHT